MIFKAENLNLKYNNTVIFKNLSLELKSGEILGVLGGNGSGKTSLCLCLSDLLPNDTDFSGQIFINGTDIKKLSLGDKCKNIGIIFQEPETQLFSSTVIDELAFAPENLQVERQEIINRIDYALDICGISHLKHSKINSLSGGEKQMVAIASVLTMKPNILIADEITSRLDNYGRDKIYNCLSRFASDGGAVLLITHNSEDLKICTSTMRLTRGADYGNQNF